jgi:glycerophosphoryl diester phosphodiesterase
VTPPLLIAHRGDHRHAPENTLSAFGAALLAGVDGIELDVRASADGQAIVLHDATLARVQGVDARADGLTAADLSRLGVPRLAEVLDLVSPDVLLDIELKEPVVEAVRTAVRAVRGPTAAGLAFSSFDEPTMADLAAVEPGWPRWLIARGREAFSRASAFGCSGVALEWRAIDATAAAAARESGLTLIAWTVREASTVERLAVLGVDVICAEGEALAQRFGSPSGGISH